MADNYYLTSPQGSQVNLGSWLDAEKGPDFGARDVLKQTFAESPFAEGRQFAFEHAGARRMSFPLLAASGGAGLSLDALHAVLSRSARPGAYIDLKPDGVPTAEMVRFDVIGGQVKLDDYTVHLQRVARRRLTVELETQPYGYWPTWIVLASSASVGVPGRLALSSLVGDVPGEGRLVIQGTTASHGMAAGSWFPDFLSWWIGPSAGVRPWLGPSPISGFGGQSFPAGSEIANFGATGHRYYSGGVGSFVKLAGLDGGDAPFWAPLLGGRYRLFAVARLTPSGAPPWQLTADLADELEITPLASNMQVATLAPAVASGSPGAYGAQPSLGFSLLDLGELNIPQPGASAGDFVGELRLWGKSASPVLAATATLDIAGAWLHRLDAPGGLLVRGLAQPSIGDATYAGRLHVRGDARDTRFHLFSSADLTADPTTNALRIRSAAQHYQGGYPYCGASAAYLNVMAGIRRANAGATDPLVNQANLTLGVSLVYRPRFAFLKGI